ncbi:MAG: DNA-formamidopyrimidine glycosylase [Alphaproteobacteria bacterium RIFOXYD12_FULL_60_8]|nr:MAG: DNA-formamidopyrimidine glycosylase [Alphaproteobacteria bacterium RIFOXYD12_FULL_60_8]
MPELPEVETVRRGLAPVLVGRILEHVSVRRPDLRAPFPHNFAARLTGQRVRQVERRAKYLVIGLENGFSVLIHLGMSGHMTVTDGPPQCIGAHDHVAFTTDRGQVVTFTDPRRFGFMDLTNDPAHHPALKALGPEPLDPAFDAKALDVALAGRSGPVKTVLLDQKVVAGLGNIYVCEALFRAGISPTRPANTITGVRSERLIAAIKAVLTEAIEAGGSTLRDHVQATGEMGYFQFSFAVYGKEGKPCPECACSHGITRIVQAGRSTFYCKKRQR